MGATLNQTVRTRWTPSTTARRWPSESAESRGHIAALSGAGYSDGSAIGSRLGVEPTGCQNHHIRAEVAVPGDPTDAGRSA